MMLDRYLMRKVHERLERLEGGSITLRDERGTHRFGDGPTVNVVVNAPRFYRRVALGGGLGAAEAYLDGYWDADDLTALLRIFARNIDAAHGMERGLARLLSPVRRLAHALRRNTRRGSRRNIEEHYDLGNDFFELFLDETLTYSCGIFEGPDATMADASRAKLDRICRKLDLRPGDRVLEVGTGWGSFALHAAGEYGAHVTTTTISREQHELARRSATSSWTATSASSPSASRPTAPACSRPSSCRTRATRTTCDEWTSSSGTSSRARASPRSGR
jgi:cyclopropane-fatty-acyl-phospholipid synthase